MSLNTSAWRRLMVLLAIAGIMVNTSFIRAAEQPAGEEVPAAEATPTPEPTPTIPPAYYEPIQTNETSGWPEGPAVYAESAILMDADTGTILYGKNIDAQKYPASITKIMTTLLAIEHSHLNERVVFSENAIWGIERNSSHIGIRIGENLSMEDCLYGIMLESANEVCIAVAEHIAGSVDAFVEMMNQRAIELGCQNTHFSNPNGLPSEDHYTSAHDMALIAQSAYQNEQFRELCATTVHKIGWTNRAGEDRWLLNHHKMLRDDTEFYYDGCMGGKTGYTEVALNTLVTYGQRNDLNLICVTMRTAGQQVYLDTAALMDYGFANFHRVAAKSPKQKLLGASVFSCPGYYLGCHSAKTIADIKKNTQLTLPLDAAFSDVDMTASMDEGLITRSYQYHDYNIGAEQVTQPSGLQKLLTQPAGIKTGSTVSGDDQSLADTSTFASAFQELPSWKYPLLIFLIFAVCFYIFYIAYKIRKKKNRKNK